MHFIEKLYVLRKGFGAGRSMRLSAERACQRGAFKKSKHGRRSESPNLRQLLYHRIYRQDVKRQRRKLKRERRVHRRSTASGDFGRRLKAYVLGFIKDPVDAVIHGAPLSPLKQILLAAVQAFIIAFSVSFTYTGVIRKYASWLMPAGTVPAFRYSLGEVMLNTLLGTLIIGTGIFLLVGIFYLINRFLLRRSGGFWLFSRRIISACVPFCILGLLGILTGFLSIPMMLVFAISGMASWLVLIYEGLCEEWSFLPRGRIMYLMVFGLMIFLAVMTQFFVISM